MALPLAILDVLNNREKAMLLWSAMVLALLLPFVAVKVPNVLGDLARVLQTLFLSKLVVPFGVAALSSALLAYAAHRAGFFGRDAIKEAVYWFVGTGVILVGHAISSAEDADVMKKLLRQGVKLTVIVEVFVNLYVLPFAAEMVVVFLASLLLIAEVGMEVLATQRGVEPAGKQGISRIIAAIGVGLLLYAIVAAATDPDAFATRDHAEEFLSSPALTLALLPVLYCIVWYVRREARNLRNRLYPNLT